MPQIRLVGGISARIKQTSHDKPKYLFLVFAIIDSFYNNDTLKYFSMSLTNILSKFARLCQVIENKKFGN